MRFLPTPRRLFALTTLLAFALLCACTEKPTQLKADPRKLMPADPNTQALYLRSCYACHVNAGSKAPLTGDAQAWAPRMAQGMDQLLTHVIDGYGGMPPLGMCMDCSAEDFEALITFMAKAPNMATTQP